MIAGYQSNSSELALLIPNSVMNLQTSCAEQREAAALEMGSWRLCALKACAREGGRWWVTDAGLVREYAIRGKCLVCQMGKGKGAVHHMQGGCIMTSTLRGNGVNRGRR